jgi:hypothetical protein
MLERRQAERGSGYQGPTAISMGFDAELAALDRGLFADAFNERTADVQHALSAAQKLAEYCYVSARDATNIADAYRNERSAVSEFVARQRWQNGGWPPTPSTPPESRTIANG